MPPTPPKPGMAVMIGIGKPDGPKPGGDKPIEFKLPNGYAPPEDSSEGDTVEALCKIKLMPGGMAQLASVDGAPVEGSDDEEAKESPEEESKEDNGMPPGPADEKPPLADRLETIRQNLRK